MYLLCDTVPDELVQKSQPDALKKTNLEGCTNGLLKQGSSLYCGSYYATKINGQFVNNVEQLNQFLVFYIEVKTNGRAVTLD